MVEDNIIRYFYSLPTFQRISRPQTVSRNAKSNGVTAPFATLNFRLDNDDITCCCRGFNMNVCSVPIPALLQRRSAQLCANTCTFYIYISSRSSSASGWSSITNTNKKTFFALSQYTHLTPHSRPSRRRRRSAPASAALYCYE